MKQLASDLPYWSAPVVVHAQAVRWNAGLVRRGPRCRRPIFLLSRRGNCAVKRRAETRANQCFIDAILETTCKHSGGILLRRFHQRLDGGAGRVSDMPAAEVRTPFIPRPMVSGTKTEAFEIAALVPSRRIVMMRRAIPAFAVLIALGQTATAGVPTCAVVRFYVAKYSEAAAETWARSHGASDAEIETARRCLHSANVQTASWAARSQVLAPVTEQERARHEPAERDPDQDALHVVPVQGQRADPEQDNHDNEPGVHGFIRPKDIEDRFAGHVSYEIKDDLVPSDGKTTTLRPRYVGAMHRADSARVKGHVAWLKRLWDHLTRRRQSSIALFAFPRSRSYNKVRPLWHHLSGTVPGHGAG
jgi:hypothetical protein